MREFAERGYDGARIERIVDAAGVNVSLAYQYFGSKEQMFIAVMEHIYGVMRTHHGDIEVRGLDPAGGDGAALARNTFRIFVKHPEIIGLLNSENVHRGKHIAKSPYIQRSCTTRCWTPSTRCCKAASTRACSAATARRRTWSISLNGMGYFLLFEPVHAVGHPGPQPVDAEGAEAARGPHRGGGAGSICGGVGDANAPSKIGRRRGLHPG